MIHLLYGVFSALSIGGSLILAFLRMPKSVESEEKEKLSQLELFSKFLKLNSHLTQLRIVTASLCYTTDCLVDGHVRVFRNRTQFLNWNLPFLHWVYQTAGHKHKNDCRFECNFAGVGTNYR